MKRQQSDSGAKRQRGDALLLVLHDATLVTCAGAEPGCTGAKTACKRGKAQSDIAKLEHHSIAVDAKGRICKVAPAAEMTAWLQGRQVGELVDMEGRCVLPGFVDCHTHAVHAGDRAQEQAAKFAGESYASVTAKGGGIHFTVRETQAASEHELEQALLMRLEAMLRDGTTCVEVKSGYGMDTATELKMLRVIKRVSRRVPLKIVSTFLGAHAVPKGETAAQACRRVVDEMLPALEQAQTKGETDVTMIDVFLEEGFFGQPEAREILAAGKKQGLLGNFHGEEFTDQNSGVIAEELGCIAVSHCEKLNEKSIAAMARAKVSAQILPTTAFLLHLPFPPVKQLIEQGVPVSLGTDYNPNAPTLSMPCVMNMTCVMGGISMQQALVGATINSAGSIAVADEVGSIEVGKRADFVVLASECWEQVVYSGLGGAMSSPIGKNLTGQRSAGAGPVIRSVYVQGRKAVQDGEVLGSWRPFALRPTESIACLSDGLPSKLADLPPPQPRDPSVAHAPRRPVAPTADEKRLAIENALRYFDPQLHPVLGPEFAKELEDYGHIYMYRFRPPLEIRAFPVEQFTARTHEAACIMHMICNNLDPAVAQFPHELVTYGGNGSVFQNWGQFRLAMALLASLREDETLVLFSGHPHGVFPSSVQAPRLVLTNGMVIPNYSSHKHWEQYYMLGVSQYGQMTAGSFCYIGPQGIVHGTTLTLLNAGRKFLGVEDLRGRVYVTAGLGGMSGAQAKAARICGAICVVAETSETALKKRHSQGWVDEMSTSISHLLTTIRRYISSNGAQSKTGGVSIGYSGNVVEVWEALAALEGDDRIEIGLGSDQTSCHNVLGGGYCPVGYTESQANELMNKDPAAFESAVRDSLRRHIKAINTLHDRGMYFFDYGNSFLLEASRSGAAVLKPGEKAGGKFIYPSYVEDIMGDIFSQGFGPYRWVCSSGRPEDLRVTDQIAADVLRRLAEQCTDDKERRGNYRDNLRWIEEAEENKLVVGSQARILYADATAREQIALAMNAAVDSGRCTGPIVISRDHHDVSGTDAPYRETSNIRDGSQFCADMAVQNFCGDAFRGATWVALHNGGGTGFGEAMNGGFGHVLDGSRAAGEKAARMLRWDVLNGVTRRAWAGNQFAMRTIREANEKQIQRATERNQADPALVAKLSK